MGSIWPCLRKIAKFKSNTKSLMESKNSEEVFPEVHCARPEKLSQSSWANVVL